MLQEIKGSPSAQASALVMHMRSLQELMQPPNPEAAHEGAQPEAGEAAKSEA